jgi:uncharacterized protein
MKHPAAGCHWSQIDHVLRLCAAIVLATSLLASALFSGAAAAQEPPALTYRPVVDVSGSLSPEDQTALTAKLNAFEARCGSQVAVVLINSARPYSIEAYANALANEWKLGRPGVGDGVLLVLAMQDREMRLEVARDMEPLLPDVLAGRILRNELKPAMREGHIREGIENTLDEVFDAIASVCIDRGALDTPLASPSSYDDVGKRPLTGRILLQLGAVSAFCWFIGWAVTSAIGSKWVSLIIASLCGAGMVLGLELALKSTYALPPYHPHYRWLLVAAIALSLWALRWRLLERMRRNGEFSHRSALSFNFSSRSNDSGYGWRHSTGSSSNSSSDSSSSSSSSSSESGGGGSYAGGGATSRW